MVQNFRKIYNCLIIEWRCLGFFFSVPRILLVLIFKQNNQTNRSSVITRLIEYDCGLLDNRMFDFVRLTKFK